MTMRAVVMHKVGTPADLVLDEVPVPRFGPGEVLVRVATVSVNRQDTFTIAGRANIAQLRLPHILGNDPAGMVVALGPGVDSLVVGTRVVVKPAIACGSCGLCRAGEDAACARLESIGVHRPGGFAEYVAVPATNAFPIPDRLGFAEATALAQSAPVALHLLHDRSGVRREDTVLVTSAAGAIGSATVQLARLAGARVIAAAGGPAKVDYVRSLGVDDVIDYLAEPAFASTVARLAPGGVSLYVESAGDPAIWTEALKTLRRRGRAAVCGSHAGRIVELDLNWLFRSRVTIIGTSGSTVANFRQVLRLAGEGRLRANVDSVRPLAEVRAAFARMMARQNCGKLVLSVSP